MLKLAFDINTGFLPTFRGSTPAIPPLRQGSMEVQLRFCQKNAFQTEYEPATLTSYLGPRLGLFTNSTFTLEDSEAYALALLNNSDFTLNEDDADDPYFSGTLNLNTTPIAALGSLKSQAVYLSVGLVRTDGSFEPILDHLGSSNATLYSATDDGFASSPVSVVSEYLSLILPIVLKDEDGVARKLMSFDGSYNVQFTDYP